MYLGTQGVGILFLKQLVRAAETAQPGTCWPEWNPQNPQKSLGMVTHKMGGRERWIPGARWPASLAFWQSSNPMSDPVSNKKWRLLPEECPNLCSDLHGHVHRHTSTYMNIHTPINAYQIFWPTERKISPNIPEPSHRGSTGEWLWDGDSSIHDQSNNCWIIASTHWVRSQSCYEKKKTPLCGKSAVQAWGNRILTMCVCSVASVKENSSSHLE